MAAAFDTACVREEIMMAITSTRFGIVLVALLGASGLANASTAGPVCNQLSHNGYNGNFDGRFYKVVSAPGISWDAARAAAELLVNDGVQGRLATINSFAEDEYVHCLIQAKATGQESWIGGSQAADSEEPAGGWLWINGELIDPTNATGANYTNWQAGEPNNDTAPSGNERHLGASLGGNFGWNDEGRLGNIGAYVVEFGEKAAPFAATECAFDPAGNPADPNHRGCTLGEDGPAIMYPQNAVVTGNMEVRSWRIADDPARCGVNPLVLDLVPGDGALVIAPYLCSTDGVIVVRRTASPVVVSQGIVQITGTNTYGTNDPVFPADPTKQDIVVYRNTLASDQLEKATETGVLPLFLGNVAETTNGIINPPRGAGGKGSYFVEGLRIHFGPGYDFATNAAGNHTQMVALQRYKLKKAMEAVDAAKPALKPIEWLAMKVLAEAALYFHDRGNYDLALFKVKLLLKLNDALKYKVIAGKNPYGEVAYRYLNAQDIYTRRLIPYSH